MKDKLYISSYGGNIMRYLCLLTMTLSLCLVFGANLASGRVNLKDLDKPILLDAGNSKRMYVNFNHSSHKSVACRTCHHTGLPGHRYAPCTSKECHALPGAAEREPLSVYMAYHAPDTDRSCYGCHRRLAGKYPGFKGCGPCHKSFRQEAGQNNTDKN